MQDPGARLTELGISVTDAIDGRRPARTDAAHTLVVNYESYFFADEESRARFAGDPVRYAGVVTDPVSKRRFQPGRATPRVDRDGRIWLFLDDAGKQAFLGGPERYRAPNLDMIGMAPAMP